MRRTRLTVVPLVVFIGLAGTARAERDLAQAIELAIQEASTVEEGIGAGVLRGTPTGVPFDGVRFSIDVALDCPAEGGGRETIALRFVVTKLIE